MTFTYAIMIFLGIKTREEEVSNTLGNGSLIRINDGSRDESRITEENSFITMTVSSLKNKIREGKINGNSIKITNIPAGEE